MSRNFELLRQRLKEPLPLDIEPSDHSGDRFHWQNRHHQHGSSGLDKEGWDWPRIAGILRKNWKLSALFAFTVFATTAAMTFLSKPIYEPVASLEVEPPGTEVFSLSPGSSGTGDAEYEETQAQKLQGDELALEVIRKLRLDRSIEVMGKKGSPSSDSLAFGNDLLLSPAENVALRNFRASLSAKRDTGTRIIKVSFAAHDPKLAALVTNTLVQAFVERNYNERHIAITKSSEWLAHQLDDIREKMDQSTRALADYERQTGITDVDDRQSTFGQRLSELNRQYTIVQADRIQSEALLSRIRKGDDNSLPQIRDNPVIQNLTQKLADCRSELSQASVIYGPNHPNVKRLQKQAAELEAELATQRKGTVGAIKTTYYTAKAREGLMSQELQEATEAMSRLGRYNQLKKQAQVNTDLYNSLYAQIKQAGVSAASKSSNVRVVDRARVLDSPTRPRRALNLAIGLLAGLVGGVFLAFLRESINTTIRTSADVKRWTGISAISIIPAVESGGKQRFKLLNSLVGSNHLGPSGSVANFLLERPHSPEAEAVRGLETSILLSRPGKPPKVLLVVSSYPGEGKTTIASNLAIALSRRGTTCLLDADLRRARVANNFGICSELGLRDLLTGEAQLESTLVSVPEIPNLSIVPTCTCVPNPGELVCSAAMRQVIELLSDQFDFVIIDAPPILPYADGRALSPYVDGIVFVSRAGTTTHEAIVRSIDLLAEVHAAPILEFVLNAADYTTADYRFYGYKQA